MVLYTPLTLHGAWKHHGHFEGWSHIDHRNYRHFPFFAINNIIFMFFFFMNLVRMMNTIVSLKPDTVKAKVIKDVGAEGD